MEAFLSVNTIRWWRTKSKLRRRKFDTRPGLQIIRNEYKSKRLDDYLLGK